MKPYRNAERTKKWIREAFSDLLFEKGSIEKISVTELCSKADITKTTFYYHYNDLYSVAEEYENELIDTLNKTLEKIENDRRLNFSDYITSIIDFIKEKESHYKKVINATDIVLFKNKLIYIFSKKVNTTSILFNTSKDSEKKSVQIYFFVSACVDTIIAYLKGHLIANLDTINKTLIEILNKLESNI